MCSAIILLRDSDNKIVSVALSKNRTAAERAKSKTAKYSKLKPRQFRARSPARHFGSGGGRSHEPPSGSAPESATKETQTC